MLNSLSNSWNTEVAKNIIFRGKLSVFFFLWKFPSIHFFLKNKKMYGCWKTVIKDYFSVSLIVLLSFIYLIRVVSMQSSIKYSKTQGRRENFNYIKRSFIFSKNINFLVRFLVPLFWLNLEITCHTNFLSSRFVDSIQYFVVIRRSYWSTSNKTKYRSLHNIISHYTNRWSRYCNCSKCDDVSTYYRYVMR